MDIDSVPFGIDFRQHIKEAVVQNDVLVAVIGPNWSGQANNSRIAEETDPVRVEIETALKAWVPIIPVLVSGATMPKATELPDGIKDLAFRNAATVDGGRDFHQHMDRLIRSIDKLLANKQTVGKSRLNLEDQVTAQKGKKVSHLPGQLFLGVGAVLAVVASVVLLMFGGLVAFFLIKGVVPPQQVHSVPIQQEHNLQQQQAQQQPAQQQTQQQSPQQAAPISCTQEKILRSALGSRSPTTITFTNKSNATVRIYWLNFNGDRILYGTLKNGQVLSQPTYLTHPWVVANTSDQCEAIYMPTPYPQYVNIN
jgi:hypothetical protein